ncbi:FtsX-like permease family protein [Tabrizicola piscis]|uniref:FtsX-like permease family protein n=2 Tax=Tabrizicola piscis TaxID=2494374 RepID=A0A3S8U7G9_9RHOB|nr:FtsX-like permease family protein [Tabrizicola piscis]AZL59523.1 FtsX-like permease family protein [Tabrizicola piscis]
MTMLRGRTPLGWLQLTHSKSRFIVASAGVGFAVLLVFMQLGFMNMLFDSTTVIHQQFKTDLVIMSADAEGIVPDSGDFSRRRLIQAAGVRGVIDWAEIYIGTLTWTKPSDGTVGQVVVIGVPTDVRVFTNPALDAQIPLLRTSGTMLIDEGSRGDYSAFFGRIAAGEQPKVKLAGETVSAIGTFNFGASFGTEAYGVVSRETFLQLDRSRHPGVINMGLLTVEPGRDLNVMADTITKAVGAAEVKVWTMPNFKEVTRDFLRINSPIATIFTFGVIVGLFVGAVIVVQILTSDVQDHLGEYATFKAMGFRNSYLLAIVYEQSAILTVFGFLPALLLSFLLYRVVGQAVAMDMIMTWSRVMWVFLQTVGMCLTAGTIAMQRIYSADPAEVF